MLAFLSACHAPPTAAQVLDKCNLAGPSANNSAYPGDLATPDYLITCMRSNGWIMRLDPDCEGTNKIVSGMLIDPPHWNDAACYKRTPENSN